jgi:hypothetical protein
MLHPDDQKVANSVLQSILKTTRQTLERSDCHVYTEIVRESELRKASGRCRLPDHIVSEYVEYFQSCGAVAVHHERQAIIEITVDLRTLWSRKD